ncbi:hypothetical protein BJX63DRAFT_397098 [Aspergillus granulosus]|uniref:Uncharacterized protein n=1 Tax=Aspergillus granulosus TaxID=176169 RepID=A0ABR4HA22_9EURO
MPHLKSNPGFKTERASTNGGSSVPSIREHHPFQQVIVWSMAWIQEAEYWSSPLNCHEKLFKCIGEIGKPLGREHWLVLGAVRVEYPADIDLVTHLKAAWKILRMRYPDIATELCADEKRYYPIFDKTQLDAWCESTFRIEITVQSSDELLTEQLRLADTHPTCHWIPASNEICLVWSHWRWDGRGGTMLFDQLLSQLENPAPLPTIFDGSEARRLIPSLDVVLEMPTDRDPNWSVRADELIATYTQGQPSIGLPIPAERTTASPGKTRRCELCIPAKEATALRQACRERGITMTTAIQASTIVQTARANQTSPATRFISWLGFDLRKYCPRPFNGPIHGPSLRMLGLPINVEARAPWHELVRSIQPIYAQTWPQSESDMLFVRVPFVEKATAMFQAASAVSAADDLPAPSEPYISSLGILERLIQERYGMIEVRKVAVKVQTLSQQVGLHLWSWKDDSYVGASYNEAYYSPADVERWLVALKENLVRNLLSR